MKKIKLPEITSKDRGLPNTGKPLEDVNSSL